MPSLLIHKLGEKICCKVKRTSFVAIDSAREVTKSMEFSLRSMLFAWGSGGSSQIIAFELLTHLITCD